MRTGFNCSWSIHARSEIVSRFTIYSKRAALRCNHRPEVVQNYHIVAPPPNGTILQGASSLFITQIVHSAKWFARIFVTGKHLCTVIWDAHFKLRFATWFGIHTSYFLRILLKVVFQNAHELQIQNTHFAWSCENCYVLVFQNACPNLLFTCHGQSGKCLMYVAPYCVFKETWDYLQTFVKLGPGCCNFLLILVM